MLMAFVFTAIVSAQQIEKIFDKYQEDERFEYIYKKLTNNKSGLENLEDAFDSRTSSLDRNAKRMLILHTKDKALEKRFTNEVDEALKRDKFENVSYVRNRKNRVSEYYRDSKKGIDKVQFIDNGSHNIILVWRSYEKRK